MEILAILALGFIAITCFVGGVLIGVKDCKRLFRIPKGAVGVDENGNFIFS